MKIKTVEETNKETYEIKVNEFDDTHRVKFMQTHVNMVYNGNAIIKYYTAVIFYED